MITVFAYLLTIGIVWLGITSLLPTAGYMAGGLGALAGGIVTWFLIDYIWLLADGGHIPFLALLIVFLFIGTLGTFTKEKLNAVSQQVAAAEMWAIVIVGIILFFRSDPFRWY